jgi:hypothetical protein
MLYDFIEIEGGGTLKCEHGKYSHEEIKKYYEQIGKKISIDIRAHIKEETKEKKCYYTIRMSFDKTDDITITEEDLTYAIWAFVKKTDVVSTNGCFRGKDIISILPDYAMTMGWNKHYNLEPEDFARINVDDICQKAKVLYGQVKEKAGVVKTLADLQTEVKLLA